MLDDDDLRRLTLACYLPGFVGPTPPDWLLDGLAAGLGGVVLFGSNLGDGSRVIELTDRLRAAAGRPIVLALDEEGGDVTRLDTVRGSSVPGAAALGWLDDPAATEVVYGSIGARLLEAGVTLALAPVADVNSDPRNPVIGVRSFGADPTLVARHVAAAVTGLQRSGVAACVKHFPGHGATRADSHHEVATVDRSRAELDAVDLVPFKAGIAAGARAVMTGHLRVPALAGELATMSSEITTDLLRASLGFVGTVVTDALEMKAISATVGMAEGFVRALIAGADSIETGALDYPELMRKLSDAVVQAVHDGRLSASRLQDAARRTGQLASRPAELPAEHAPTLGELASISDRCVQVHGRLPALVRPLVVECRTENGMASGALPWSLAEPIRRRCPAADTLLVDGPFDVQQLRSAAAGRTVVAVVRDPVRHQWQQPLIQLAAELSRCPGPAPVLVDLGWPADLPGGADALAVIRTRGIAPGLLEAAADALVG